MGMECATRVDVPVTVNVPISVSDGQRNTFNCCVRWFAFEAAPIALVKLI